LQIVLDMQDTSALRAQEDISHQIFKTSCYSQRVFHFASFLFVINRLLLNNFAAMH